MRHYYLSFVIILSTMLTVVSCAGMAKDDCLRRVAAAEIAVTQSYESTTKLYVSGVLTRDTAKKAVYSTDTANGLVDAAGRLCNVDNIKAEDYLAEAASLLLEAKNFRGE